MKALLRVLAIVALMAKTTNAELVEYNENGPNLLLAKITWTSEAKLINPKLEVEFQRTKSPRKDLIILKTTTLPSSEPAEDREICNGNFHGIYIKHTDEVSCNITEFVLQKKTFPDDSEQIFFRIRFKEVKGNSPTATEVKIPVFKISASMDSANPEELNDWATAKNVGVLSSPFDEEKIKNIAENKPVLVEFNWLNELLRRGISKNNFVAHGRETPTELYVTRPLLLPGKIINTMLDLFPFDWQRHLRREITIFIIRALCASSRLMSEEP